MTAAGLSPSAACALGGLEHAAQQLRRYPEMPGLACPHALAARIDYAARVLRLERERLLMRADMQVDIIVGGGR